MSGAVNAVIGTSAQPGGTWTIQSTNTASVGRFHDLAFLAEAVSSFTQARPGVLSGFANAGATVAASFAFTPTGSGLNLFVFAGSAVVERTSHAGPYTVVLDSTATVTFATADPTNSRIDRVDLQVLDGALGDNGGTSQTALVVTTGVASGTPTVPAAPANSIPICQVLLPATTTTLTSGMVTDTRKSAALRGATRLLLPGDSLSDPGYMAGETRLRYHATYGWLEDYWDPVASLWRGTQVIPGLAATWGNGTSNITLSGAPAFNTIASVAVADPGWPYKLRVSAKVRANYASSWSTWTPPFATVRVGLDSTSDASIAVNNTWAPPVATASAYWGAVPSTATGKLTGAHTVYLSMEGQGGGGAATVSYANWEGNPSRTDSEVGLTVDLIPVGT